jgi:hypothetical protein
LEYETNAVTLFVDPAGNNLPGDLNLDGIVNDADIDRLAWAAQNDPDNLFYDLNDDGMVSFAIGVSSDSDTLIRDILDTEYGDLDLDGDVFLGDLDTLVANYGKSGQFGWADGNINGSQQNGTTDPRVTLGDFDVLVNNYGSGTGAAAAFGAVPEPGCWLLALSGVLAAVCRKKRYKFLR